MSVSATSFFIGASELATLTNTFTVAGVPTDPTTISLTVTSPSNVVTTYTYAGATITRTSTGIYTKDVTSNEAGIWQFVWTGTGTASDVVAGTWTVFETDLGRLYGTVAALKSRLGITDTSDDFELHGVCFAASRAVEQICQRLFWRTPTAVPRTFEPQNLYKLCLPVFCDLISVTTLKTDAGGDGTFENTWLTSDYQLYPTNPLAAPEQLPYTEIRAVGSRTFPIPVITLRRNDLIEVTGIWGWPSIPYGVRQGALIAAAELFKLKDAPFGVAGFGEFGVVRIRDNPKIKALLGPYMHLGGFS